MDETIPTPEKEAQEKPESAPEQQDTSESGEPMGDFPLPPASFEFLVLSLRSQAEMQLGLLHFGEEKDRPKPNLSLARHSIDMLGMVQEKTKGNLTLDESRLLENSLTELRYRFVQVAESGKKQ